ncbi:acyl-CoA dehydrogenase family protein, partial [Frankia sp. EI5c]|uniref:acyl-CoA dehydrogenase family protein n=1 Tax=Frankia sp. EI5c TaxID=683316 RepID=UPI001F5B079A
MPPAASGRVAAGLRAEVRAFAAEHQAAGTFTSRCDAWLAGWDEKFSRALADRGWLGLTLPTRYGGHGRSALERYVVTEELLAAGAPVAAHWIADRQIGPTLLRFGTEAQRERFLPGIARGECYFAIGMSEPDAGSDLAAVRTRATRADGGWIIDGTKVWTSGAHHAHAFFVLARSAPVIEGGSRHDGLSQFIVPLDSPGVTIRPILLLTGEHHFNEVHLDGVFV